MTFFRFLGKVIFQYDNRLYYFWGPENSFKNGFVKTNFF